MRSALPLDVQHDETRAMGKFFTGAESGLTRSALRSGVASGRWVRAGHDVYREGSGPLTEVDRSIAAVHGSCGYATAELAAIVLCLERYGQWATAPDIGLPMSSTTRRAVGGRVRRRDVPPERIVVIDGIPCTDALQTLVDTAAQVSDDVWEQALEGALRNKLTTIGAVMDASLTASKSRLPGAPRMRRVLARRPAGAVPTGSLLETMAIQMLRLIPEIPVPARQLPVKNAVGVVVGKPDLSWPDFGAFLELKGKVHEQQLVHDSSRETAIVAATGWLPSMATWPQVTRALLATARGILGVLNQARRRTA